MKNINNIQIEIDLLQDDLRLAIIEYIKSNGEVSISEDRLGNTENIDIYDADGVSRERAIRTVCISGGELRIIVADIHHGEKDSTAEVTNSMLNAVVCFLKSYVKL